MAQNGKHTWHRPKLDVSPCLTANQWYVTGFITRSLGGSRGAKLTTGNWIPTKYSETYKGCVSTVVPNYFHSFELCSEKLGGLQRIRSSLPQSERSPCRCGWQQRQRTAPNSGLLRGDGAADICWSTLHPKRAPQLYIIPRISISPKNQWPIKSNESKVINRCSIFFGGYLMLPHFSAQRLTDSQPPIP
jgi:hypothetical protein